MRPNQDGAALPYSAQVTTIRSALEWGLMNKIVPAGQLRNEVRAWADQMLRFAFNEKREPDFSKYRGA